MAYSFCYCKSQQQQRKHLWKCLFRSKRYSKRSIKRSI